MGGKSEADLVTFLAELTAGRWDDHLNAILEQVGVYAATKSGKVEWKVTTDDWQVVGPDATLDELERMEQATGATWFTLSPQRSAQHCRAVLQVLYQTRGGLSAEDAEAKVKAHTRAELDEIVGAELVIPAPLD